MIHLGGQATFSPSEWLARKVPQLVGVAVTDPSKEIHVGRREMLAAMEGTFESQVNRLYADIVVWAGRLESECSLQDGGADVVKVPVPFAPATLSAVGGVAAAEERGLFALGHSDRMLNGGWTELTKEVGPLAMCSALDLVAGTAQLQS